MGAGLRLYLRCKDIWAAIAAQENLTQSGFLLSRMVEYDT